MYVYLSKTQCDEYRILCDYKARESDEINLKKGKAASKHFTYNIIDAACRKVCEGCK